MGAKKKVVDPFSKKGGYEVKALTVNIRHIGKTLVTRTQGFRIASDAFEVSFANLQSDKVAFRKFRLINEDIQG